jgi:zinc transport system ATP-binding protein
VIHISPKAQKENIVEFDKVSFVYGNQPVIKEADFSIERGDFFAAIGPNGGGKTTIIKLMLGFLRPSKGMVRVFGKPPGGFGELKRIGYVPQKATNFDQDFPATVLEVASMGRFAKIGLFKNPSKEDRDAVIKALDAVHMLALENKRIGELSGGQQQRVFIARALATEPEVLILDEPLAGVDAESQHRFYALLRKLNKENGITLLLVSHDVSMVSKDVTKLACINVGVSVHDVSNGINKADLVCSYEKIAADLERIPHHHD